MPTTFAKPALLLALALTLPLIGCASQTGSSATKVALCDQFRPIRWSASDTDETIRQAKEANAVGKAICGW